MDIVIFDTNAYRNLVTDKDINDYKNDVNDFKEIEEKNDISALMHPIVIKELLYHVAGERNKLHYTCLNALKAMYFHCGNETQYAVLADFDLQLSNFFYKVVDPNRERIDRQLGEIVAALALHDNEKVLTKYQFNLKQIREQIKETEDFFKEQLKVFIHKIDPECDSWSILQNDDAKRADAIKYFNSEEIEDEISLGYVSMVHDHLLSKRLITSDTADELKRKADIFKEVFQVPIKLYKEVLKKFVQPDFNMDTKSRENFVWDIHIMFTVGDHILSGTNSSLYLITSDKEMRNAAKAVDFSTKVFSFPEYYEVITGRKENFKEKE